MILICFQKSISNYIQQMAHGYVNIKIKLKKTQFVNDTVHELRRQGYRFLTKDANNRWFDIGDAQTIGKVGKSLRAQARVVRTAVGVHVGCGVASQTDENRTTLGQRTIMAAAGAHGALQEQAMAGTSVYDNPFTAYTESTTTATISTTAAAKAPATTTNTTSAAAARPSAAKKPRLSSEDMVRLFACPSLVVMADLQHERQENGRLRDEIAHLRQVAFQSRVECFTLQTDVSNLSVVLRELWSQQDGTVVDLRSLSAYGVQVVAQLVGLPPPSTTTSQVELSATAADKETDDEISV
jgi:hypothetical protein